ncbi:LacI family transcriptional regulator [Arthrobacter sp. StoSoilB5]|nr:LacI family transcriptional regulator [Arthrobacter sp. StoSoilB5]
MKVARRDGRVITTALAQELGLSEITARRAINSLCSSGHLVRVHGGATLPSNTKVEHVLGSATGLVVPTSDYYYARVIAGAESVAAQLGTRLVLGVTHYDEGSEKERVQRLIDLGVRGILLATSVYEPGGVTGKWLDSLTLPVVLMERSFTYPETAREYDSVRSDHTYGAALAVRHLAELGHTSIGLAIREETPTARGLKAGYEQTVAQLKLDVDAPYQPLPIIATDPEGTDIALNAFLDECIRQGTKAAIVHVDTHASRLVELAASRGIRVPEDLSIVAYDDEVAAFALVPLTAVSPPKHAVGASAMRLLDARLGDPTGGNDVPIQHLSLMPGLTVRESTTKYHA